MIASSLFSILFLFLGQFLNFSLAAEAQAQNAASTGMYLDSIRPQEDGYPGLDQLKAASAKFAAGIEAMKNFNGDLATAQNFFQQSLEAIRLLDEATAELSSNPAINIFTALSYTPVANKFAQQAQDLSTTLLNKKAVLVASGWGDNTYQLLDSLYSSGANLMRTYFSKRGGLVEWAAGPWENSLNAAVGNAREAFRGVSNNMVTSTVIVYAPAPTAPSDPYYPPSSDYAMAPPAYAAPPQQQQQQQQQQYRPRPRPTPRVSSGQQYQASQFQAVQ